MKGSAPDAAPLPPSLDATAVPERARARSPSGSLEALAAGGVRTASTGTGARVVRAVEGTAAGTAGVAVVGADAVAPGLSGPTEAGCVGEDGTAGVR
jgi:hypothetical protein